MMKIQNGLWENMVIRRNVDDVSEQPLAGTCSDSGNVRASVFLADGYPLKGLHEVVCGVAANGKFHGVLKGIPAGGPYRIRLWIDSEKLTVDNVLVGDVWILAGQSNMQGYGNLEEAFSNPSSLVRAYYMDDHWGGAKEPLISPRTAKAPVHWKIIGSPQPPTPRKWVDPLRKGVGPGVSFANEMRSLTNVPQGVICCAHGGTCMDQWDPAKKSEGDDSLYGAMLNRIQRNGGLVSGLVWYQGCAEATPQRSKVFQEKMIRFFKILRHDLHFPDMPIIQTQIARVVDTLDYNDCWTCIREIQRTLPDNIHHLLTVPAVDLELDDSIHLRGKSQIVLGHRYAEAAYTLTEGKKALPPPIELESVKLRQCPKKNEKQLIVTFRNVAGKLCASGRPLGFVFNHSLSDYCFRTELKGNRVILHCMPDIAIDNVAYGAGMNPSCNITDSAGRSLPAFAYVPVNCDLFKTPYAKKLQVSEVFLCDENLDTLEWQASRELTYAPVLSGSLAIPADREEHTHKKGLRFFRTYFEVSETLHLNLLLGYDGPVKVFVDGHVVYMDKAGTNPISPDEFNVPVIWEKGKHEVLIALAQHGGNSWGISICIARSDLKCTIHNFGMEPEMPIETTP